VALRFFEGKTFQEIGTAFRVSETRPETHRLCAGKIEAYFFKRGVTSTTGALPPPFPQILFTPRQPYWQTAAAVALDQGPHGVTSTLALVKGHLKLWHGPLEVVIGASVVVLLAVQHHQNTAQARQIAAARQQLKDRRKRWRQRKAAHRTLEQQTAGFSKPKAASKRIWSGCRPEEMPAARGASRWPALTRQPRCWRQP